MTRKSGSKNRKIKYSVIVPVFNNAKSLDALLLSLEMSLAHRIEETELVFVIDGSKDESEAILRSHKNTSRAIVEVLIHSRNFGSFAAIRTGIQNSHGHYLAVVSADLQEPPQLLTNFFDILETDSSIDIVIGERRKRNDPIISKIAAVTYWRVYRLIVNRDIPRNGFDVFACTQEVAKWINSFRETRTSLVGIIFWLGFNRSYIKYDRGPSLSPISGWTAKKKFQYMSDSIFAFSDTPIRVIRIIGIVGLIFSTCLGLLLFALSILDRIQVPGYIPIMLTVLLGNSSLLIAVGIIGSYIWRTYENSKQRPFAIVRKSD